MTENKVYTTDKIELFGKPLYCTLQVKISNSNRDGKDLEMFSDFDKVPGRLTCIYGKEIASMKLNTRDHKRIITGCVGAKDLQAQLNNFTLRNCLINFGGVVLDNVDLTKNNCGYETNQTNEQIVVMPTCGGYIVNGKFIKELSDRHIIYAFSKEIERKSGNFILGNNGKMYTFVPETYKDQVDRSLDLLSKTMKDKLTNWDDSMKIASSEITKKNTIPYMINNIIVLSGDKQFDSLNNGTSKNFDFKDATSEEEKNNQLINKYRKNGIFIKETNEDAVIKGFKEEYVDKVIEEYKKTLLF